MLYFEVKNPPKKEEEEEEEVKRSEKQKAIWIPRRNFFDETFVSIMLYVQYLQYVQNMLAHKVFFLKWTVQYTTL